MLPLRVLVADDHRLFRQGLIGLMKTRPDLIQVIGEAESGHEAIRLSELLQPDVVLMDIKMPGNGLKATARILETNPRVAVVMLTASELDEHLYEAVRLGASGYLLKSLDASELFDLLEGVARGEAAMTRAVAARLLKGVARGLVDGNKGEKPLTEREMEVLRCVARGASNPQIAEELSITVNTVKSHIRNILTKLDLTNRTQAAAYAVEHGLVSSYKS